MNDTASASAYRRRSHESQGGGYIYSRNDRAAGMLMLHRDYTYYIPPHPLPADADLWVTVFSLSSWALSGHAILPRKPVIIDSEAHKSTDLQWCR